MIKESWLPIGFILPDGLKSKTVKFDGLKWQIIETQDGNKALLVEVELYQKWFDSNLLDEGCIDKFSFGNKHYGYLSSTQEQQLSPISNSEIPGTKTDALAFSQALKATREHDNVSPLQDAIYVEKLSRLLPTFSISSETNDGHILGYWLTGGANISVNDFRRLQQILTWLSPSDLKDIVTTAGFEVDEVTPSESTNNLRESPSAIEQAANASESNTEVNSKSSKVFSLSGRPELESFFNEHIVDILQNRVRYKALGIGFPSAIALHGPPGCGKTFAVEQLVEFLGWPSFEIDASSVASPYIHETSKKVAEVFNQAIENSPSVLVIDEMEAFLADREMGSGHNRVEEVAEFLRRIPEAAQNDVLIIAMTNRIEIIDPAILRRGRFDHVIKVGFANEIDVKSLLDKLLSTLPKSENVNTIPFAKKLAGRPLSDVSFVIREGARLAAKAGKDKLDQESLQAALDSAPAREREGKTTRRIGFI